MNDSFGFQYSFSGMGSVLSLTLYEIEDQEADSIAKEFMGFCENFESRYSRFRPNSLVSQLNLGKEQEITPEEFEFFQKMLGLIDFTEGYFFPFITPEIRGYTSVSKDTFTGIGELQEEKLFGERENFLLEPSRAKLIHGTRLDLGAIGKGYAADCGKKFLEKNGVQKAIINFGGDILVFGFSSESPAILGIQDPRKREEIISKISLSSGSLATSGTYLRKWKYKGEIQDHIFQPKEGEKNLISVSIQHESCATADAIATALIAMGQKKAQEFSKRNGLNAYSISK